MDKETAATLKAGDKVKYVHDVVPDWWGKNFCKKVDLVLNREYEIIDGMGIDDHRLAGFPLKEVNDKVSNLDLMLYGPVYLAIEHFEPVV